MDQVEFILSKLWEWMKYYCNGSQPVYLAGAMAPLELYYAAPKGQPENCETVFIVALLIKINQ